jgi:hypothetical protein
MMELKTPRSYASPYKTRVVKIVEFLFTVITAESHLG